MSREIETFEIPYARTDERDLVLRIIRPKGRGPFPAMLDIHGGAWTHFDHTVDTYLCAELARRGFVMLSVDFRLAPRHPWPTFIGDIRGAAKFALAHAAELRIDPTALGAIGGSTGGHLSILLGLIPEDEAVPATPALGTPADTPVALAWAVGLYPVVDVVGRYRMAREAKFSAAASAGARLLRGALARRRGPRGSRAEAGSPNALLTRLAGLKSRPVVGAAATWAVSRALYGAGRIETLRALEYPQIVAAHEGAFADETQMHAASPLEIVRERRFRARPPLLVLQGRNDPNMTDAMTRAFEKAYRTAGGRIEVQLKNGLAHGFGSLPSPQTDWAVGEVVRFVKEARAENPVARETFFSVVAPGPTVH